MPPSGLMRHRVAGDEIRRLRERAGHTQSAVARRAGIASGTLSRIETGNHDYHPSPATLRKIADALDVPYESLLVDRPPELDHEPDHDLPSPPWE